MGHKQSNCPLTRPPREAPGFNKVTNTVTSAQPQSCTGNQQESQRNITQSQLDPVDTEFARMSRSYQSADITTVTGEIGPLYYATVTVEGTPVQALVDPGSSATIMSFNLFQKIGKAAHIPVSALRKPDIALRVAIIIPFNNCILYVDHGWLM